jgi:hypothetical protein
VRAMKSHRALAAALRFGSWHSLGVAAPASGGSAVSSASSPIPATVHCSCIICMLLLLIAPDHSVTIDRSTVAPTITSAERIAILFLLGTFEPGFSRWPASEG